jgi:putative ABC transport system permease protein
MQTVIQDVRYGLRMLRRNPGFTITAVVSLALGIGASTAIYSVTRTVLFDPLPVSNPARFIQLFEVNKRQGWSVPWIDPRIDSWAVVQEFRQQTNLFARLGLFEHDEVQLRGQDFPETVQGLRVTPEFFSLWAIRPMLGRFFAQDESQPGHDDVIILSHHLWQSRFGGDPAILGRTIPFIEQSFTVVGVMPPYFRFPRAYEDYWRPFAGPPPPMRNPDGSMRYGTRGTGVIAELKSGVPPAQVQAYLDVLLRRLATEDRFVAEFEVRVRDLREMFVKPELRRTLWALLGAAALTLLIVCVNVANLQLARTETRQHELAIRAAIGAGRLRLIRQLLTENVLLACVGGLAALMVTAFGLDLLPKLIPPELPRFKPISLNLSVLAVALVVSLATGILFGLTPAWAACRAAIGETLKLGAVTSTRGARQAWSSRGLIVGQMAVALVLLTGAGLMVRSVVALLTVNPGFDPHNVVEVYPGLDLKRYPYGSEEKMIADLGDLQQRVAALPGVEGTGVFLLDRRDWEVSGNAGGTSLKLRSYFIGTEAANPLAVMRVPLRQGRWLERNDASVTAPRVLLNESAARRLWPGEDPVGKRLWARVPGEARETGFEVVGIVGDLRLNRYDETPGPTVYRAPTARHSGISQYLVVRTSARPPTLYNAIGREFKTAGADVLSPEFFNLEERLYDATVGHRTLMCYLTTFAGVGLLLSAIGIYGVLAYSVARRTKEIGIRLALGAARREVIRLIVTQGMRLTGLGVVLGLAAALGGSRVLRGFLFGVRPLDPVTYIVVVLLLVAVALLACWLPARRAAKVDPMKALRWE